MPSALRGPVGIAHLHRLKRVFQPEPPQREPGAPGAFARHQAEPDAARRQARQQFLDVRERARDHVMQRLIVPQVVGDSGVIMLRRQRPDRALLGRPECGNDLSVGQRPPRQRLNRQPERGDPHRKGIGKRPVQVKDDAAQFRVGQLLLFTFGCGIHR